jgi:hypothetical protein
MLEHEIVHAARILDPEISLRSSPVEEGLATMFGGDRFDDEDPPLDPSIILVNEQLDDALEYHHAGQTMALLLDRHGMDAFRRFDTGARTMDEDAAFVAAFGESKEQFIATVENAPHCEQSQWWAALLECDGEPIVADPLTGDITLTGNISCGDPDTYGPRNERVWTARHFRTDRSVDALAYDIEMPDDATLEIIACQGGCPERMAYIGTRNQVGSVLNGLPPLEPGNYFLRMSRPASGDEGRFEIVIH